MSRKPKKTQQGIAIHCHADKVVSADDLQHSPHHKREHPQAQLDRIKAIIKANGWRRAVVISKRCNLVTRGRGAVMAMAGDSIPVVFQDYADEAAEQRDIIADNRATEGAIDDEAAIAEWLTEQDSEPEDYGFTADEVEALMNKDIVPTRRRRNNRTGEKYTIAFDNSHQAEIWTRFLQRLQRDSPGVESVAERITEFVKAHAAS